jgi:cation:H+ antiporter
MMLGSVVLLWLFALDGYVTHTEGFALVTAYAIYLAFVFGNAKKPQTGHVEQQGIGMAGATSYLVVGLATVVGSAELTVSSATQLALALAIDQSFIAVIIIGLGSSLPELSISLSAALKRRARLSVGNLIGSNIFDTLIPIGLGAIIADLEFGGALLRFELPVLFVLSGIVLAFFHQTRGIQKREASVILGLYLGYAVIKIASL